MKKTVKITLSLVLAFVLAMSMFACALPGAEETEPEKLVPATQSTAPVETTPIYTRPSDEGEVQDPDSTINTKPDGPENEPQDTPQDTPQTPSQTPEQDEPQDTPQTPTQEPNDNPNEEPSQSTPTTPTQGKPQNPNEEVDEGPSSHTPTTEPTQSKPTVSDPDEGIADEPTPTQPKPTEPTQSTQRPVEDEEPEEDWEEPDEEYVEPDPDPESPNGNVGGGSGNEDSGNVGGGSNSNEESSGEVDDESGESFTGNENVTEFRGDAKPLSWDNLNAFPIKSSSMSTAELRKLCVDFFRYCKTALWTPTKSIDFVKNAKGSKDSMSGGSLYGGLPYVGLASGNMFRLLDYMNSSGKVDMADALKLDGSELSTTDLRYFGNQCANGAFQGWARVVNSVAATHTAGITKRNGYIPLGNYKYDTEKIKNWSTTYGTDECVAENGTEVMFESYAKLQLADGLVYYTTAGHVVMVSSTPVVVRGADGKIDGEKSFLTIIDQAQTWQTYTGTDGRKYQIKSGVDTKVTFQKLFDSSYVPYTYQEFTGADDVEKTTINLDYTGDTATLSQLFKAKLTANYSISDAYIIVTDASGKEVYKHAVRNSSAWGKTLKMAESGANVDSWGTAPTEGTYTVKVVAQLGTGERPTVWSGTLTF